MTFKPNMTHHLGVQGVAKFKNIPHEKQDIVFPNRHVNYDTQLIIRPNLSIHPQTYGLYTQDRLDYVCDLGSRMQRKYIDINLLAPPTVPIHKGQFEVDSLKELAVLYVKQRIQQRQSRPTNSTIGINLSYKHQAYEDFQTLFTRGYIPTAILYSRRDEPVSIEMKISTSQTDLDAYASLYLTLVDWGYIKP